MSVLPVAVHRSAHPERGRSRRMVTVAALTLTVCAGTMSAGLTPAHADLTVTTTTVVGHQPSAVAFSPDGALAYVPNQGSGSVSVLALATGAVTTTLEVGNIPTGVAVSPDGKKVYVPNSDDGAVSVVDVLVATSVTPPVTLPPLPARALRRPSGPG